MYFLRFIGRTILLHFPETYKPFLKFSVLKEKSLKIRRFLGNFSEIFLFLTSIHGRAALPEKGADAPPQSLRLRGVSRALGVNPGHRRLLGLLESR